MKICPRANKPTEKKKVYGREQPCCCTTSSSAPRPSESIGISQNMWSNKIRHHNAPFCSPMDRDDLPCARACECSFKLLNHRQSRCRYKKKTQKLYAPKQASLPKFTPLAIFIGYVACSSTHAHAVQYTLCDCYVRSFSVTVWWCVCVPLWLSVQHDILAFSDSASTICCMFEYARVRTRSTYVQYVMGDCVI